MLTQHQKEIAKTMNLRYQRYLILLLLFFGGTALGTAQDANASFFENFQLPNGLRVIVLPEPDASTTTCRLFVDYPLNAMGRLTGLPAFCMSLKLASAQEEGPAKFTDLKTDAHSITGKVPVKDTEALLAFMGRLADQTNFDATLLEKQKAAWIQQLNEQTTHSDWVADRVGKVLCFSGHPYGEITTATTLANIELADCQNFWEQYGYANLSYLVISGKIEIAEAKILAEKYFGKWPQKTVYKTPTPGPDLPKQTATHVLFLPKSKGFSWQLTYPFYLRWGNDEALPTKLIAEMLQLKLKASLAQREIDYTSLKIDVQPDRYYSAFCASVSTNHPEQLKELSKIVRETMGQLEPSLSDEKLLKMAKEQLTNTFLQGFTDQEQRVDYALQTIRYKLDRDFYSGIENRIKALKPEDLQAAFLKYFHAKPGHVLLVGNEEALTPNLPEETDETPLRYVNLDGVVMVAMTKFLPDALTADQVLDRYIRAIGGEKKLARIRDLIWWSEAETGGEPIKTVLRKKTGSKMNLSVENNGKLQVQIKCDGKKAGIWNSGKARSIEGEELNRLKIQSPLFPELVFMDSLYKKEKLGITQMNGVEAYHLRVTSPDNIQVELFFDLNTGLKVSQSMDNEDGNQSKYTHFEDYRLVNDILFPWKVTTTTGDSEGFPFITTNILLNQHLTDSVFLLQ
ncbi:MAG: peptidase M16 [Saprospiraceae bacterium]|nr:MAG: peptidase M16 [Saprospiraceae bacterium]